MMLPALASFRPLCINNHHRDSSSKLFYLSRYTILQQVYISSFFPQYGTEAGNLFNNKHAYAGIQVFVLHI
jgi:hypothetical protein